MSNLDGKIRHEKHVKINGFQLPINSRMFNGHGTKHESVFIIGTIESMLIANVLHTEKESIVTNLNLLHIYSFGVESGL